MGVLSISGPLKKGKTIGVDPLGIYEVAMSEVAYRNVPLALRVLPQDWFSFWVIWCTAGVIFHPYVVEAFGTGFETHANDGAVRVKQANGLAPENPGLEVVAVPTHRRFSYRQSIADARRDMHPHRCRSPANAGPRHGSTRVRSI
ncbi:hypothetical protein CBM2609_U10009 [Cupriavidus taiwanensis]|nr:hypothetical protein CBM2604_U10088 [Cupriavidus taiwanensis]SOZ34413.1 hypothetical protein CBM2609_U10009 [Cupriavidus taiwanensis]SOZ53076.1 hypothetical protein CBM2610_U10085 [Cupriavidus taiwanensis]